MSLQVFPLTLAGWDIKVSRTPVFSTNVQTSATGKELRSAWASEPRYKYSLTLNFAREDATTDEAATMFDFFNDHQGRFDHFLFDDPYDGQQRLVRFESDTFPLQQTMLNTNNAAGPVWEIRNLKLISVKLGFFTTVVITSPTDDYAYVGDELTYTALASCNDPYDDPSYGYAWAFDDGTTDTGATVYKTWDTIGNHVATVTATNHLTGETPQASKTMPIFVPMVIAGGVDSTRIMHRVIYSSTALAAYVVGGVGKTGSLANSGYTVKIKDDNSAPITGPQDTGVVNQSGTRRGEYYMDHQFACIIGDKLVMAGMNVTIASPKICVIDTSTDSVTMFTVAVSFLSASVRALDSDHVLVTVNTGTNAAVIDINDGSLTAKDSASQLLLPGPISWSSGGSYHRAWTGGTPNWGDIHPGSAPYQGTDYFIRSGAAIVGTYMAGGNDGSVMYSSMVDYETGVASMGVARAFATACALSDGRILVAGGVSAYSGESSAPLATGEVYNPTTNSWSSVSNSMQTGRWGLASCLLPNGNILIVGGCEHVYGGDDALPYSSLTIDFYNPTTNKFYPVNYAP